MNARRGFTLVEIMIVVALIALLVAIAVPAYNKARENSLTRSCINGLRLIDGAKDQYALDEMNATPTAWSELVPTYIQKTPACKGGGVYTMGALDEVPTCDYPTGEHAI